MKKVKYGLAALLCSCGLMTWADNSYTLTGDSKNLHPELLKKIEGKMLYLTNAHSRCVIDSALVTNGNFTFQGTVEADSIVYFSIGANQVKFILQPGKMHYTQFQVTGTPLNDEHAVYKKESSQLYKEIGQKLQAMQADSTLSLSEKQKRREAAFEEMNVKQEELITPYILKNKDNPLNGLLIEAWTGRNDDVKRFDKAMAMASERTKRYAPIAREIARMDVLRKVQEGMPFVDFTVPGGNLDGTSVSFSDYIGKGKYVLVDFWASWCGPCRGEIPNIKKTYERFHGDRFDVLSIAVWDQKNRTLKALEEEKMPWPQIINSNKIATDAYGIIGIPQIILFAPDGTIAAKGLRGDNVEATVEKFLNK